MVYTYKCKWRQSLKIIKENNWKQEKEIIIIIISINNHYVMGRGSNSKEK